MDNGTSDKATYVRYTGNESKQLEKPLVREAPWTIHVNGQELVTLLCSPCELVNCATTVWQGCCFHGANLSNSLHACAK